MTDRAAFLAEFKRLTRDGTGNAVVPWRALDQIGAVLDYGMNTAEAIWASSPGGGVIEIAVDGRWMPATSLPPTPETKTGPVDETGPAQDEGESVMSTTENATPPSQEPAANLRGAAIAYALNGTPVFPVDAEKHPLCTNGHKDATTDLDQIGEWWTQWPTAGIATVPGLRGQCVVDIDPPDGEDGWQALQGQHEAAPPTYTVRSPRGGRHLYFAGHLPPSVGKLAPHVDTRGDHSYVLLPPSRTADGVYTVEDDADVAEVPTWIAHALARMKRAVVEAPPDVVLDLEINVARARRHLASREKLVEGQQSDEGAFILACELRELGISRDTALDMLTNWQEDFADDWWDEKVNNAYRYGQNGAGAFAVRPAIEAFAGFAAKHGLVAGDPDPGRTTTTTVRTLAGGGLVKVTTRYGGFPEAMDLLRDLTEPGKAKPKADKPQGSPFRVIDRAEFRGERAPGLLIPELEIPRVGVVLLVAHWKSLKGFFLLDIMGAVATGQPVLGEYKPRKTGAVVYAAGEGQAGIKHLRIPAWEQAHHADLAGRLGWVPRLPAAADPEQVEQCLAAIDAWITKHPDTRLVAFDTYTGMLPGDDQNSPKGAGQVINFANALADEHKVCVVLVHHTGKDAERGSRGTSALPAGVDLQIVVVEKLPGPEDYTERPAGHPVIAHLVTVGAKESEGGKHVYVEAVKVPLPDDTDSDGEPVTGQSSLTLRAISRERYDELAAGLRKGASVDGPRDTNTLGPLSVSLALREMEAIGVEKSVTPHTLAKALANKQLQDDPRAGDPQVVHDAEAVAYETLDRGSRGRNGKPARYDGLFDKVAWPRGIPDARLMKRWFLPPQDEAE